MYVEYGLFGSCSMGAVAFPVKSAQVAARSGRDDAPVGRGRVALEVLRPEGRIAQPVEKDARDDGTLVVGDGFFLDHRRERHDVADAEPRGGHDVVQARPARPREDVPAAVELALHAPHDVARVAVEGQIVGGRKEEALGAVAVDARGRAGARRPWSRRGNRAAGTTCLSWSRRAMSKRFHPSGNVTRAVPADARRSRRAISSRGLASSASRCLPTTTPLVPPVARTQSAKSRGSRRPRRRRARSPARRRSGRRRSTISTPRPCPGPRDDG